MTDTYICNRPVLHDGKAYPASSQIELTSGDAAPLLAGNIVQVSPTAIAAAPAPEAVDTESADADAPTVDTVKVAIRTLTEDAYTKSDPRKPRTSAISDAMAGEPSVSASLRDEAWDALLEEGFTVPTGTDAL